MKKGRAVISLIIILCLGVTSFICSKAVLEQLIYREVGSWLQEQPELFTSQLTDEQQGELLSTLKDFSNNHEFIFISESRTNQQSSSSLYTFSVFSSPAASGISFDPLVVLGTTIVDTTLVQKVASANPNSYAGYGNDSFGRIADLPSIRSGVDFRVDQLGPQGNLGSSCKVLGLSQGEFQELVGDIASSTGVKRELLTNQMSGTTQVPGLLYVFSAGAFFILAIVFCLLMVTHALLELKTLGVYLMLGWSKRDFVSKLFSAQALQLLAVIPLGAAGTYAVLDGFALNSEVLGYACATMVPTILVVAISLGIASLSLVSIKPVDAISSRYSKRGFYLLTAATYLMCLAAVYGGCLYIDQPFNLYANIMHTRSTWSEYADWYVLQDFRVDDALFTGDPMKGLSKDMYAWYAAHEHDEGVYLANTSYYGTVTIQAFLPDGARPEPFWYLKASPSYLRQIGIEASDTDVALAESGVRVYLLPKSLDAAQADATQRCLAASDRPFDSNITTRFTEDPQRRFSTYDGSRQLFTWSTDAEQPVTADNFVIAVITANNMGPTEAESLIAAGLENDYVKLDERGGSELLDDKGTAPLGEGSLGARFATVAHYIDGLQKNLEDLFALFSIVMLMMVATIAVMIVCLINIVNQMSAREIGVKYVLGFGMWELYKREVLFVNVATLAGILVCVAFRSSAGMIVGAALLVVSNFVIFDVMRRKSAGVVLELVSEEQ